MISPQDRDASQEPLWQLAEALGADCLAAYTPAVTHVVAAPGSDTAKVRVQANLIYIYI